MSKFFEFTDVDGRKREAEGFVVSDFTVTSFPNAPVRLTSAGQIHPSLLPPVAVGKAAATVVDRKAAVTILRGDVVRASSLDFVSLADASTTQINATALGVALNDAAVNSDVEVLVLGIIADPIFSVFAVNDLLYLDVDGGLTNVRRLSGYLTPVGKSLGGNEIFINVGQPLKLA